MVGDIMTTTFKYIFVMELFNKISKAATESSEKLSKFTSESSVKLKEQATQIDQHTIIQKAVEIEYDKVEKAVTLPVVS